MQALSMVYKKEEKDKYNTCKHIQNNCGALIGHKITLIVKVFEMPVPVLVQFTVPPPHAPSSARSHAQLQQLYLDV